jgi:hypothetical protein
MKVELLKDVMLPHTGTHEKANDQPYSTGVAGDVVEMDDNKAKAYIKKGLAKETEAKVTVKPGEDRKVKPSAGPTETKAPAGTITTETVKK